MRGWFSIWIYWKPYKIHCCYMQWSQSSTMEWMIEHETWENLFHTDTAGACWRRFHCCVEKTPRKTSVYNTKHMFLRPETSICNILRCVENLTDISVGVASRTRYGRPYNLGLVTGGKEISPLLLVSIPHSGAASNVRMVVFPIKQSEWCRKNWEETICQAHVAISRENTPLFL